MRGRASTLRVGRLEVGKSAGPGQEGLSQVVPLAIRADLDHVAGPASLPGGELEAFGYFEGAAVVPLEAFGVHVGEEPKVVALAHGAGPRGVLAQVPGGSQKLGMGVADLQPGQEAAAEV